jgi:hypothetical protein
MRRDYFTLEVDNVDWVETDGSPSKPTVTVDFEGPASTLRERLTAPDDELLDAEETDVAYRLQGGLDDEDARGVVSVTNRVTGDYVLELNEDADDVLQFITAAREYGTESDDEDGQYAITIIIDGEEVATYQKNAFLVYDADGDLMRQHSLIPSGVEL